MDSHAAQVAHILRRTGFGIRPGDIERWADTNIGDLVDARLADEGWFQTAEEAEQREFADDGYDMLHREWLARMLEPEAGLHERMVWYWHAHFTSTRRETTDRLMWRQHQLIRRNALGNFRELARAILEDGAMLHYLDGAESRGDSPNENLSREYLELFTRGRNAGYTEADVRAGARILSGWWVDWETGEVGRSAENAYDRPVSFLGVRKRWNLDEYVDAVLAGSQASEHIAAGLHSHFVSTELTDDRKKELGALLRSNDWEIRPFLAELLRSDEFLSGAGARTRQPVEWLLAAASVLDFGTLDDFGFEAWQLQATGQTPFEPPNVAGWADDDRWSSATQVMIRANTILDWEIPDTIINSIEPTVDAVLIHCGLFDVSPETRTALDRAIEDQSEYDRGLDLLLMLVVLSPEFATT